MYLMLSKSASGGLISRRFLHDLFCLVVYDSFFVNINLQLKTEGGVSSENGN
jgi:hypothetical protein